MTSTAEIDPAVYQGRPTRPAAPLIAAVRWYQRRLSRHTARVVECRFYPSCSEYAVLALRRHGARRGTSLAVRRWVGCSPRNTRSCIDFP